MTRPPAHADGFTLIETLVVLTILALVAAVSVPLLRPPSNATTLQRAAREMAAAMRATGARALARNTALDFTVDAARATYAAPDLPETALPPGTTLALTVAALARAEPDGGSRAQIATFRFYPDGTSSGGSLTLRRGDAVARVEVDWLTGQAKVTP